MCTRSVGPIPILVKDHSRVLCEQLQQLRNQTGLVDLDIVCEDHHINVHKVVMAACSRFFKDQLCKQNVQVPVILRLEDFGLELKRDAVSYIIEFVYRGEVNIPGDKLTEVCAAAHSLGVIGLTEFLPVPAETQRPALISKEPLQIAEESELRRDINNIYNSFSSPVSTTPTSMGKFSMDINNINPFFMNNNAIQNDDIILLQTADEDSRNINTDPDIIPISFSDSVVAGPGDMAAVPQTQRLYPSATDSGEQYRIIPEILSDGTFHEETIDSCFSLFPGPGPAPGDTQELSPAKAQSQDHHHHSAGVKTPVHTNPGHLRHGHGKTMSKLQQSPAASDVSLPMSGGHQTSLQALFEAASTELVVAHSAAELPKSAVSCPSLVFSSPGSSSATPTICSTPAPALPTLQQTKIKQQNNSMSQGKLRVINQGIQSENIQSPSCLDKTRRRSGQVSGCQSQRPDPVAVAVVSQADPDPAEIADEESESEESDALGDTDEGHCGARASGDAVFGEEIWAGNKSWTHPVESVDTSVPTSGAVWQLPSTNTTPDPGHGGAGASQWKPISDTCHVTRSLHAAESPGPAAVSGLIPWNTPVMESPHVTVASSAPRDTRDTPPSVSVSWTQPQSSACPSPGQQQPASGLAGPPPAAAGGHLQLQPQAGGHVSSADQTVAATSTPRPHGDLQENIDLDDNHEPMPGPSWKNSFGSDDNMLAIRSGIPLALQNKAIRSGVPIGPFQNKRKRKSRFSQEGEKKVKKRATGSGASASGKKGDLEVRKDLILEPQGDVSTENVFVNDESCASTSNIVSKTKEESSADQPQVSSSPIAGGVHIKTVKKLNSDAENVVADFDLGAVSDTVTIGGSSPLAGESSKTDKYQYSCVNLDTLIEKKKYSCLSCPMMFATATQLKRHTQNVHGKEETLFCQVCPARCIGKENLKLHLFHTHGIGEIFRCEECSFESPVKSVYIKHLSEHQSEEAVKKQCPKCDKVFKTKTGLNMHLKQHFDESLYSCPVCEFKTPQRLNLIKHTASKHGLDVDGKPLDATFSCEYCEFKCIAEHMLKNHVMRKHTQKSAMRFRCSLCNYATVEKAALDKHMRFKHTNERPFMCDTCGFSTHTASAMARHKRSHSNAKPHKCEVCGHEYADRKRLRDHMYTHTDHKPFQCPLCSYVCRRKDTLAAHMRRDHDTTKLEKLEKCEVVTEAASTHKPAADPAARPGQEVEKVEPPGGVWQSLATGASVVPVVTSVHLPTIALGDIVLTSAAEHGGGQEISWSVGTPGAATQEEVIFVAAAEQQ